MKEKEFVQLAADQIEGDYLSDITLETIERYRKINEDPKHTCTCRTCVEMTVKNLNWLENYLSGGQPQILYFRHGKLIAEKGIDEI